MTQITRMEKGRNGWKAETTVDLPFTIKDSLDGDCPAQLRLSTYKHSNGGLVTYAGIQRITGGGAFRTTSIGRDYHVCCRRLPDARCTEKSISEEHAFWVGELTDGLNLVALATAHHAALGDNA